MPNSSLFLDVFDFLVCKDNSLLPFINVFNFPTENDPADTKSMGRIFGVIQILDLTEQSEYLPNLLAQVMKKEFFRSRNNSLEKRFESAVHKANLILSDLAQHEITGWVGKVDAAIGASLKNEIHLVKTGKATILLAKNGKIANLSEKFKNDSRSFKIFDNIFSGKLEKDDKIIFGTQELLQVSKYEEFSRHISVFKSEEFDNIVKSTLEMEGKNVALIIGNIKETLPKKTPPPSKKLKNINFFGEIKPEKKPSSKTQKEPAPASPKNNATEKEKEHSLGKFLEESQAYSISQHNAELYIKEGDSIEKEKENENDDKKDDKKIEKKLEPKESLFPSSSSPKEEDSSSSAKTDQVNSASISFTQNKRDKNVKTYPAPLVKEGELVIFEEEEINLPGSNQKTNWLWQKITDRFLIFWNKGKATSFLAKIPSFRKKRSARRLILKNNSNQDKFSLPAEEKIKSQVQNSVHLMKNNFLISGLKLIFLKIKNFGNFGKNLLSQKKILQQFNSPKSKLPTFQKSPSFDQLNETKNHFNSKLKINSWIKKASFSAPLKGNFSNKKLALGLAILAFLLSSLTIIYLVKKNPLPSQEIKDQEEISSSSGQTASSGNLEDLKIFSKFANNPSALAIQKNEIFALEKSGHQLAYSSLEEKQVRMIEVGQINGVKKIVSMPDLRLIFILAENGLFSYSPVTKKVQLNNIDLPSLEKIGDCGVYMTFFYVFDQESGQLFRYPRQENGFGEPKKWLKESLSNKEAFSSFAVDENVRFAFKDGRVEKWFQGKKIAEKNFSSQEEPLTISRIKTDSQKRHYYLLDNERGIFLKVEKATDNVTQKIQSRELIGVVDFEVDEKEKNAYFIQKDQILWKEL